MERVGKTEETKKKQSENVVSLAAPKKFRLPFKDAF